MQLENMWVIRMINFVIKDENGNIIYERYDEKGVLTEEEIAQIYEALENLDTNSVDISLDCKNLEASCGGRYSCSSLFHRSGKDEILKETKEVIDEYNRQVAALPERHPSEHDSSLQRGADSVGPDGEERDADMEYDGPVKTSDDLRSLNMLMKRLLKEDRLGNPYEFKPYSWQKHLDRHGWTTIQKHNGDFGHYSLLGDCRSDVWGRDGCDCREDVMGCDGRVKRTLGVVPGTFCGPDYIEDDKHKEIMQKIRDKRGSCEGASDDVELAEEWELTETQKHQISVLKDFIGYLRTRDSWATLLDELGFYNDPNDSKGKTELINKFRKYMLNKEKQEYKKRRDEKRTGE